MDRKDIHDTASRIRKQAATAMDTLGIGGNGVGATSTAIREALLGAGYASSTTNHLAEWFTKTSRIAQDANESLYGTTGQLIDAMDEINTRLKSRGVSPIF